MRDTKFQVIKKYIDEFDYYSLLAHGAPSDEFDSYTQILTDKITEEYTIEDIAMLMAETMDKAFENEIKPEKYIDTAGKIRDALYFEVL